MEWYEIVISAVATLGGVGGFISIYKAKPKVADCPVLKEYEKGNCSECVSAMGK